jgi:hypothetical protein
MTWACSNPGAWIWRHLLGSRQLTDIYSLALAVRKGGRLVTFDRALRPAAVEDELFRRKIPACQVTPDELSS